MSAVFVVTQVLVNNNAVVIRFIVEGKAYVVFSQTFIICGMGWRGACQQKNRDGYGQMVFDHVAPKNWCLLLSCC